MIWSRLAGDIAALFAAVSAFIALSQPRTATAISESGSLVFSRASKWQIGGRWAAGIGGALALTAALYDLSRLI